MSEDGTVVMSTELAIIATLMISAFTMPLPTTFRLKIVGFDAVPLLSFGKLPSSFTMQLSNSEVKPEFRKWITENKSRATVVDATITSYNPQRRKVNCWRLKDISVVSVEINSISSDIMNLELAYDELHQSPCH